MNASHLNRITPGRRGRALVTATVTVCVLAGGSAAAEGMLGVLTPQLEMELEPRINGQLLNVHVRIGDVVQKGALIAELDSEPVKRDLDEASARFDAVQAEREAAETQLRIAEDNLQRRQMLIEQQAVSRESVRAAEQAVDLAVAELNQTNASVKQQEAIVEQHRTRLRHTRITAPFTGTVAERYGNPGMSVGPGQPIVRLISNAMLRARFAAPVEQADALVLGRGLRVVVTHLGEELNGTLSQIGSEVDPASGMIICEATVELPEEWNGPPLSGQTVRIWLAREAGS